jgi:DNA-binding transcriptional MerR regulator
MNTDDAIKRSGISYRQLDFWITKGYLKVSDPNPGSGYQRQLSPAQFAILVRMAELVRMGVRPELAAKYARKLRSNGKVTIGSLTISEGDAA